MSKSIKKQNSNNKTSLLQEDQQLIAIDYYPDLRDISWVHMFEWQLFKGRLFLFSFKAEKKWTLHYLNVYSALTLGMTLPWLYGILAIPSAVHFVWDPSGEGVQVPLLQSTDRETGVPS